MRVTADGIGYFWKMPYSMIWLFTLDSKGELIMEYGIYEKKDQFALHGIFDSLERAERHIKENIPVYVARSYFTDKTLTADSFEILPYPRKRSGSL